MRARGTKGLPLALHIALLCAAVAVPLLLLTGYLLTEAALSERARLENGARAQAHDMALLIERELRGMVETLQGLATMPSLKAGDFETFDRQAREVLLLQGTNLVVRDRTGQQMVNTRLPWGAPLPRVTTGHVRDVDETVFETRAPQVSNLFIGAVSGRPLFMVVVPVLRDDQAVYVLNLSTDLRRIGQLMELSNLAPGWWGTVADRDGTIVARTLDPDKSIGNPLLPEARDTAAKANPEKSVYMRSPEGIRNFAAFARVPSSGWTVAVAVPEAVLLAPLYRSLAVMAGLVGLAVAGSAGMAFFFGRRLAGSVGGLASAASALGHRTPLPPAPATTVRELNQARFALIDAERELNKADADMNAARLQAEAASRAKSAFLAAVSHDLRQPFQAMRLYHHILTEQAGPEVALVVDHIGKALTSGEELLASLVDLSVLDSGNLAAKPESFAIAPLLTEVVDDCRSLADAAGLDLRAVGSSALVVSDRVLLKRMVRNLVVNAIRYTAKGGVLIGCRRKGGRLLVQVLDTGIGIAEDKLPLIFEEFYQVANPSRDRSQGLGLGLAIVTRLGRMLDHPVAVRSVPGKGSAFTVTLAVAA